MLNEQTRTDVIISNPRALKTYDFRDEEETKVYELDRASGEQTLKAKLKKGDRTRKKKRKAGFVVEYEDTLDGPRKVMRKMPSPINSPRPAKRKVRVVEFSEVDHFEKKAP